MAKSSILDNTDGRKVGDFLKQKIQLNAELSIVSAYFTIHAYEKMKNELDGIKNLRFLYGEPTFIKSLDPEKVKAKDFQIEDDNLVIPTESVLSQKKIAKNCAEWIKNKVEIKSMVKPNFLHGKMYVVDNEGKSNDTAIVGSSNFTVNGLGLGVKPNIELNIEVHDKRDFEDLKDWFNELWNNNDGLVEDVKTEVLKYIEQLYTENEPEFIYFKTLFHIFENFLNEQNKSGLLNENIGFFESEIWAMLFDFQRDGVKGAINKILKHNGCIIADSVGLGKTFEALAVIKYFELLNYRVLVLCPKKLSNNWTIYQANKNSTLSPFTKDRFHYNVMYHTDLGRERGHSGADGLDLANFNWHSYDLVVIDESHNFRGNPMEKEKNGNHSMNRPKFLMEKILKSGAKTKVLLLSATPVNNTLRDLRNQIYLITHGNIAAMKEDCGINDIGEAMRQAQTQFTNWADPNKNPERSVKKLMEKLDSSFFKLLDEITIARSRNHIKTFYNVDAVGKFPERLKPIPKYAQIDLKNRFDSYIEIDKKISQYKLAIFNPSAYVFDEYKKLYNIKTNAEKDAAKEATAAAKKNKKKNTEAVANKEDNFDQSDRENYLIGMMKVNFLKRLESSIESFEFSMERTVQKVERLELKINDFIKNNPKQDSEGTVFETEQNQEEFEEAEVADDDLVGTKIKYQLKHIDLEKWLEDLKNDKKALNELYEKAFAVVPERDAKLDELKKLIDAKIKNPINEGNRKIIIFTAYADTAKYLYGQLHAWAKNTHQIESALVAGSDSKTTFGKNDFDAILVNFSPISKNRAKMKGMTNTGEIDLLIATDCISEGQNLQDADYLINYDIHWNPVRIIQRFGRIDRIGSKNDKIQLVNFWPTEDLDNYIKLKTRVESRMALVDMTATGEDNLLASDSIEDLIEEDMKYRDKQLLKLKDEVLDLEDMNESISLTDFTLDDFRVDLLRFLDKNRKKLETAPLGLYAVVPSPSGEYCELSNYKELKANEKDIIKPGVIYCLRQKDNFNAAELQSINPLQPYYLVYVRNDGEVRYNYTNAKQILEIFRILCQDKNVPYEALCDIFNQETNDGGDMETYNVLLKNAVEAIQKMLQKRNFAQLSSGTGNRSAILIPTKSSDEDKQNKTNQFELITWLVIK
jgi:Helicase conserved C-terminal domain/PLD-like domain/SNF2-related domain